MSLNYYNPKSNEGTSSNIEYLRIKEGTYKVRILPPKKDNGVWYVYDRKHFLKDNTGRINRFPCTRFSKGSCLLCTFKDFLLTYENKTPELEKLSQSLRTNVRVLLNVVDLTDNKIKILEIPHSVFKEIQKFVNAKEDWGEVLHPEEGRDFRIERKGSGMIDTEYSVMPSPKQTKIPIEITNDDLIDLEELVDGFNRKFSLSDIHQFLMDNYSDIYDDFVEYLKRVSPNLMAVDNTPSENDIPNNIDEIEEL